LIEILKLTRIDQWTKNILIFLPILASGQFENIDTSKGIIGFIIFGLAASFVYTCNDLIDVNLDKIHPTKKKRVIAAGKITKKKAIFIAILLFIFSIILSYLNNVLDIIILYFLINIFYNFFFKKIKYLDVICLSLFYVIRIFYGGSIFEINISYFLIAFSFLIFLSLAFVKRLNEIKKYEERLNIYEKQDSLNLYRILVLINYISISIFIYYIFSDTILVNVESPKILIIAVPLIFYWMQDIIKNAKAGIIDDNIIKYVIFKKKSAFIIITTFSVMIISQI
tara:strand:+ start:717 stop:1562 length:846 start_codon:yes stop_codon:yes gene_type:complete